MRVPTNNKIKISILISNAQLVVKKYLFHIINFMCILTYALSYYYNKLIGDLFCSTEQ